MIHYGGDGADVSKYRKGTLFLYHNTFVSQRTETSIVRCPTNDEHVEAFHNVIYATAAGSTIFLGETLEFGTFMKIG
jgi:hypothetical protein